MEQPTADLRILTALRKIIHAADVHSRKLASIHGITSPQLLCLLALQQHGSLKITDLNRHLHVSPGTTVGIVDRLESKQLVRRERDQTDRRKVIVHLTESGMKLLVKAPPPLHESLSKSLSQLTQTDRETIAQSLEQFARLMDTRAEEISDSEK